MGELRVDFAGAEAIATALKNASDENRSALSTLTSKASPEAVWSGSSATAYRDAYDRWHTAETNLIEALDAMGQAVKSIINDFDNIDKNGASAFPG
jgi:WXG100 family type VII secretion target